MSLDKEKAEQELKEKMQNVKREDIQKVLREKEKIEEKFKGSGPLGKYLASVKVFFSLIKDYFNDEYTEVPWWTIAAIVTALLYVFSPIDLIPDVIPGIGLVDDALVIAACLTMVEQDLENYKQWKMKNL